jgi:hypothetical protein
LEHDDGLLEYPEDIFGTATLAPIETALAKVERLGEKRAEKIAGLRIEEEKAKAKCVAERKEALTRLRLANEHMKPQSRCTTICGSAWRMTSRLPHRLLVFFCTLFIFAVVLIRG